MNAAAYYRRFAVTLYVPGDLAGEAILVRHGGESNQVGSKGGDFFPYPCKVRVCGVKPKTELLVDVEESR